MLSCYTSSLYGSIKTWSERAWRNWARKGRELYQRSIISPRATYKRTEMKRKNESIIISMRCTKLFSLPFRSCCEIKATIFLSHVSVPTPISCFMLARFPWVTLSIGEDEERWNRNLWRARSRLRGTRYSSWHKIILIQDLESVFSTRRHFFMFVESLLCSLDPVWEFHFKNLNDDRIEKHLSLSFSLLSIMRGKRDRNYFLLSFSESENVQVQKYL